MSKSRYDWQAQRSHHPAGNESQARWELAAIHLREGNLKPLAELIRVGSMFPDSETRETVALFLDQHCTEPRKLKPLYSTLQKQQIVEAVKLDHEIRKAPIYRRDLMNDATDRTGTAVATLYEKQSRLWLWVRHFFRK